MKYYAVTDDPRELYHYGVKGMKWGQHIFGDKPKSPGYSKALGKLRTAAKAKKPPVRKDVEVKADRRYQKQLQKALRRSQLTQAKYGWDQVRSDIKANNKALKLAQKAERKAIKSDQYINNINAKSAMAASKYDQRAAKSNQRQAAKAAKAEKHFDKYLQDAREGHLRAGKLSDEQIQRINSRLAAERQARQMGGTEKMSWRQQKKEARRAGKLQGITRGTAAVMEEVARAGATFGIQHLGNKILLRSGAKQEGKNQRAKDRARNKKTHRDIVRDVKQEAYEAQVRDGQGAWERNVVNKRLTGAQAAKALKGVQENRRLEGIQNEIRENNERQYQQYLANTNQTEREALANLKQDVIRYSTKDSKDFDNLYGWGGFTKKEKQRQRDYLMTQARKQALERYNKMSDDISRYNAQMASYGSENGRKTKPRAIDRSGWDYATQQLALSMGYTLPQLSQPQKKNKGKNKKK